MPISTTRQTIVSDYYSISILETKRRLTECHLCSRSGNQSNSSLWHTLNLLLLPDEPSNTMATDNDY